MGFDRGDNSGITGLISLENNAVICARAYGFKQAASGGLVDASGRGDDEWGEQRPGNWNGTIAFVAILDADGWPSPTKFKGVKGNAILQYHTGMLETVSIRVIGHTIDYEENKNQDNWRLTIVAQIRSQPTFSGFQGTQTTPAAETFSDKELWANLIKVVDENKIQDQISQRFLLWGVGDSNSAEITKIQAAIAAAATPMAGLKLRPLTFTRYNKEACYIDYQWARTNTKDDIELPNSNYEISVEDFNSAGMETIVTDAGSEPEDPIRVITNAKKIRTIVTKLNDGTTKTTFIMGPRTPIEEVEWLQSHFKTGTSLGVDDDVLYVEVTESSVSDPTGLNPDTTHLSYDSSERHRQTDSQWVHVHKFLPLTAEERVEAEGTENESDPAAVPLLANDRETVLSSSSTPPTAPDHSARGQVCRRVSTKRKGKIGYAHTFYYGFRSVEAELISDKTRTHVDKSSVDDEQFTADIYTGSAPSDPSPPAGMVLADYDDLSTPNPTYTMRVYHWRRITNEQAKTFPRIKTDEDTNRIDHVVVRAQFVPHSSPPENPADLPSDYVKLINRIDFPQTTSTDLRVWVYGTSDTRDKFIQQHYQNVVDASGIKSLQVRAGLDGDTITTPSGYVLRETKTFLLTGEDVSSPRTGIVKVFGLTTIKQDIEFGETVGEANAATVRENRVASIVPHSGTEQELAVSVRAAFKSDPFFEHVTVKKITPDEALQIIKFGGGDKTYHASPGHTFREAVRGVPASAIVSSNFRPGAISWADNDATILINFNSGSLRARPIYIRRTLGRFRVRRIYTDVEMSTKQFLALRGQANAAPFFGYSQSEVIYSGPAGEAYLYEEDGDTRLIMDYVFQTDNWKHFGDGLLPEGPVFVIPLVGFVFKSGLFSATWFEAGYVCDFPQLANFSGFIT